MLIDAIEGRNGITIGDPCIVRKNNRYFLHISISKNVDTKKLNEESANNNKDKAGVVA